MIHEIWVKKLSFFFLLFHIFGIKSQHIPTDSDFSEGLKPPGLQYPSSGFLVAQLTPDVCSRSRFFFCVGDMPEKKIRAAILSEVEIPTVLVLQFFSVADPNFFLFMVSR